MDNKNVVDAVNELGLKQYGDFDGDIFVANIPSSDIFSGIYSEISNKYDTDDEENEFNSGSSVVSFTDENIEIITSANYDTDVYSISVGAK